MRPGRAAAAPVQRCRPVENAFIYIIKSTVDAIKSHRKVKMRMSSITFLVLPSDFHWRLVDASVDGAFLFYNKSNKEHINKIVTITIINLLCLTAGLRRSLCLCHIDPRLVKGVEIVWPSLSRSAETLARCLRTQRPNSYLKIPKVFEILKILK